MNLFKSPTCGNTYDPGLNCAEQTCIVTGHSASHVKVVTSLCKWSSMYKYGINENGQTLMQLYTIDMTV